MKKNPEISVIIPIYNGEKYLKECLDSVINQTFKDIEIICVNDGSTDDTSKILNFYSKKDNRIIIINQPNSGAGAARNNALKIATGKYLSILDADDIFETNMLEIAYHKAEKFKADITVYSCDVFSKGYISKMVNSRNRINEKIIFLHVSNTEEICDLMHSFLD